MIMDGVSSGSGSTVAFSAFWLYIKSMAMDGDINLMRN
jgi:hypothetical protein